MSGMIKWKLREIMARYRIANVELADKLDKHRVTIARMKAENQMPRISGDELDALCDALNDLARKNAKPGDDLAVITPAMLLDYSYASHQQAS